MPDLNFKITGVETTSRGLVPLLQFKLGITNSPASESIRAITLQTQIQLQPAKRTYTASEQEKLIEIFGTPDRWSETLRNKLWMLAPCNVSSFLGNTEAILAVPCTFDLNVIATKYFEALEEGDISLLFLFNGSVFYATEDARLQVQQIPWDKECTYRMPLTLWRDTLNQLFPNSAWINLHRDLFDRLCAFKRRNGFANWDETIQQLLCSANQKPELASHEPRLG